MFPIQAQYLCWTGNVYKHQISPSHALTQQPLLESFLRAPSHSRIVQGADLLVSLRCSLNIQPQRKHCTYFCAAIWCYIKIACSPQTSVSNKEFRQDQWAGESVSIVWGLQASFTSCGAFIWNECLKILTHLIRAKTLFVSNSYSGLTDPE